MNRFVYGTDEQFKSLKQSLSSGYLKRYNNISLPACFNKRVCRLGFEKYIADNKSYVLLIDYGITCEESKLRRAHPLLRIFLKEGEVRFMDFNDLKVFLKGLRCLYE